MRRKTESISLDCARAEKEIVEFIRRTVREAGANGAVIGLSGGIDSSVVGALLVRALGKEKVVGILMPASHTPEKDNEDARMLSRSWGIETHEVPIDSIFSTFAKSLPKSGERKIAYANVKARIRMIINYYFANARGMLVAGTGDRSEDLLGYFCYDERTRAVTADGLKGIDELKKGDMVFSIDPKTQRIVENPVERVFRFPYEGQMIHFRGRGADLMVTPNHRMLVHTTSSMPDSGLVFRRADECLASRDIPTPVPVGWTGSPDSPKSIKLVFTQRHTRRAESLTAEDAFYLLGLFVGDGCVTTGKVLVPVKPGLTRIEYSGAHRGSDGRLTRAETTEVQGRMKEYETFETTFPLPNYTNEAARKHLTDILNKYGIGYSLTGDAVRISSRGIHDFFAQCGVDARNKRIPRWILDYPSEYLVHLLRGLKDSGGSHRQAENLYYTSSERLKDDFVQLCFKLGLRASVTCNRQRTASTNGKTIRSGPSFTISYSTKRRLRHTIKSRLSEMVNYRGQVWCPSVPPFENLLVERNGRYVFSGNTKYGDGGVDFLPIAHLYKTQIRLLGTHLGLPEQLVNKPSSPQLWPGHRATDEIPIDYDRLDPVLAGLFDEKLPLHEVSKKTGVELKVIEDILSRYRTSVHKRTYPPMMGGW